MKKKNRRFCIGDIHGELDYLIQVIKKSNINYENDELIFLGDVMDRGLHPFKCMDELLKFKNLILIKGNHDSSFISHIHNGFSFLDSNSGTEVSIDAWNNLSKKEKIYYNEQFLDKMIDYYISDDNIIFTHGGFDRLKKVESQISNVFQWDRELVNQAMSCTNKQKLKTVDNFKEIFIGHTPTIYWDIKEPIIKGGVVNVDTGSGKGGKLTIMDIDTKEYWQSN